LTTKGTKEAKEHEETGADLSPFWPAMRLKLFAGAMGAAHAAPRAP
jgi:hypothetical protein